METVIAHDIWWPLHLRSALGETLTDDEQAILDAAYRQADAEDREAFARAAVAKAQKARARIERLDAEEARLLARRQELDREIARLESLLDAGTRQAMGIKDAVIDTYLYAIQNV